MFIDAYQHDIIRKYVAYFGAIFSNLHIDRNLSDGTLAGRFKVPLHFAKMEHALERVIEDPNIDRPDAIILPAMSYDLIDMKYNGSRKQTVRAKSVFEIGADPNNFSVMHSPVPYDFHFRLSILVKNIDDALKIVEGICPYFGPDYTATLELIPDKVSTNIPIVLESTAMEFDVPKEYKERVTLMYVMDFNLQGYLYGPEKKWPMIKFANVGFFMLNGGDANSTVLTVTTQPGLTANGTPTTDINDTVPYSLIKVSDDYGYVEQLGKGLLK